MDVDREYHGIWFHWSRCRRIWGNTHNSKATDKTLIYQLAVGQQQRITHICARAKESMLCISVFAHIAFYTSFVDHFINVIGRHAWLQFPRSNIQDLTSKSANLPHAILVFRRENRNIMSSNEFLLRARYPILRVVRVANRSRYRSFRRQWIDRSQRTRILVIREGVVMPRCWIWFRNYLWRKEIGEEITLRFMHRLMFALYQQG